MSVLLYQSSIPQILVGDTPARLPCLTRVGLRPHSQTLDMEPIPLAY